MGIPVEIEVIVEVAASSGKLAPSRRKASPRKKKKR
jgi:hypothetical protein